ncbi:hypothetical protein LUZ60_011696 [Juncus effusus]|nr:hypothetical protein LUZ60_011696 [Juncus effusus]
MDTTSFLLISLLLLSSIKATKRQPANSFTTTQDLATCLSSTGVDNFSLYATSSFHHAFNISVQNLRFVGSSFRKPEAMIFPSSMLHLRNTILCLRAASLLIRIRSGGHSYEGLSYTVSDNTPFAVIDITNLNKIRIDLASQTAWVESGATLGEVYHAISDSSLSLAFPAGSCPTVGSGGHISGGGFGFLSRKYGLAADNVVDAVLIDPFGRALNRASMGEDVFWAIRGGGGGNWGAVYAWNVKLVAVPNRVSAFMINRPGSVEYVAKLVDKWQSVAPFLPDEFYLSAFVGVGLPESEQKGNMSVTFKGLYLGPKQHALRIVKTRFADIGLLDLDVNEMSWIESVVFFSGLPSGSSVSNLKDRVLHSKTFFKGKSDYVRAPISMKGLTDAINLLAQERKAYVILDPYGGAINRIGPQDIPFPHRKGNLYAIQYLIEWVAEDDQKREHYMNWIKVLYDYMQDHVSKNPRAAYVNYLDLDLNTIEQTAEMSPCGNRKNKVRVWGERYFLGNYDRLVRAKTVIDPYNVFSTLQSVPPMNFWFGHERDEKVMACTKAKLEQTV